MVNVSCYLFLFKNDHPNSRSILKMSTSKEKFHQPRGGQKGEEKGRWGGRCWVKGKMRKRGKGGGRRGGGGGQMAEVMPDWQKDCCWVSIRTHHILSPPPPNTHTSKCIVTLCLKTLPFLFLDFPGLFLFADRWGLHCSSFPPLCEWLLRSYQIHVDSMWREKGFTDKQK